MPPAKEPLSAAEYDRMADELESMAETIRLRPEMNHNFAERLALLAKQIREDAQRADRERKS
jgi:hypothetical protein